MGFYSPWHQNIFGGANLVPYNYRLVAPSALSAGFCLGQAIIITGGRCRWGCALIRVLFLPWVFSLFDARILLPSLQRGFVSAVLFQNIRQHTITVITLTLRFFFLIYPSQKFSTLLSNVAWWFPPRIFRSLLFSQIIRGSWINNPYIIFSTELNCVWRFSFL